MGEGILDFAFNQRQARRLGNRHEYMSPHGCYPCQGRDEWVTLAVRDDADWQAFCRALGQPSLLADPRFADPLTRYQHQDELDAIISQWTSTRSHYQVMEELQAQGVPAGPALNARQLLTDPHLRARGFFEAVEHPPEAGLGRREYLGRGWKLSGNDLRIRKPAPRLGEDNHYVLGQLLGLSSREIDQLRQQGVIGETLEGASIPAAVPLARQVELGWLAAYDSDYQQLLSEHREGKSR